MGVSGIQELTQRPFLKWNVPLKFRVCIRDPLSFAMLLYAFRVSCCTFC
jgi:hypothetical protein